jgi:hypothetical protein
MAATSSPLITVPNISTGRIIRGQVSLIAQEREQLKALIRKGKAAAYKIQHANILHKAGADGAARRDEKIAAAFSVPPGPRQAFGNALWSKEWSRCWHSILCPTIPTSHGSVGTSNLFSTSKRRDSLSRLPQGSRSKWTMSMNGMDGVHLHVHRAAPGHAAGESTRAKNRRGLGP